MKRLFLIDPPVSPKKALQIAERDCGSAMLTLECLSDKPDNVCGYMMPDDSEPCWWIPICPRECWGVGGGQIMAISKLTGKILYKGSDGGE